MVAVQVEDEGEVICQVFNQLGEDLAKANLTVRGKYTTIKLKTKFSSKTDYELKGKFNAQKSMNDINTIFKRLS